MHIALVISSLNAGGAERVLSELANYWGNKHQISLITFASSNTMPFYKLDPNINLIQLNQTQANYASAFTRLKNIIKRIIKLRFTIKNIKPNIIISFVDLTNITTLLATINLTIPVVIAERTDPKYYKLPKLYQYLRHIIYPRCYKLIVQTNNAANYFLPRLKKLITVIPNPVLKPKIYKNYDNNNLVSITKIITIGRLDAGKDHLTLIHAFSILSKLIKNFNDLTLTIYGEGSIRPQLEQLIKSLNLQQQILLPGIINDPQPVLTQSDLFVFPSKFEGFPNALAEAMAVGLPVIASNCSGNIDLVQDNINGRLFPVGDINGLTNIMQELIRDYNQCYRLAQNAKNIYNQFSADRIFKLWDNVIVV